MDNLGADKESEEVLEELDQESEVLKKGWHRKPTQVAEDPVTGRMARVIGVFQ